MVIADGTSLMDILSVIGAILTALTPIVLIILTLLVRKGKVSKQGKKDVEEILAAVTGSIDTFKGINKAASKELTSIIGAKADMKKVSENLEGYLGKFGLNKPNEKGD